MSVCTRRKGASSQDKKDSCPSDPCPHKICHHSQPADTSSLRWGRVAVALGRIVPRMKNVGVGNHIKDLELFRNPFPSDHQTRVQRPFKASGNFGTIDLAPCLSVRMAF